jgi:uncharacterized protein (TIGR03435 family)
VRSPVFRTICFLSLSALCLLAEDRPTFAVASIRPHAPNDDRFFVRPPSNGGFSATGSVAKLLVMLAYDVQESQITGGGSWFGAEKWDIEAKSDDGGKHNVEETRRMFQNMLEERFALRVHRGTQERPAYLLTIAKGGSKLKAPEHPGPTDIRVMGNAISRQRGELSRMTQLLSGALGRPVVDRTGLSGIYDIQLQWDDAPIPGGGVIGLDAPAAPDTNHGSIFTAVEQQLGLRLVSGRAPVEMLVIDQIKPASEN